MMYESIMDIRNLPALSVGLDPGGNARALAQGGKGTEYPTLNRDQMPF